MQATEQYKDNANLILASVFLDKIYQRRSISVAKEARNNERSRR